jgi:putative transposase
VLETALIEKMTEHLGHEKHRSSEERDSTNIRNGTPPKTVLTEATGQVEIELPRDRAGGSGSMRSCCRCMPNDWPPGRSRHIFAGIYDASVSNETISRITDKVIEQMKHWANRPPDGYAVVFIDATPQTRR